MTTRLVTGMLDCHCAIQPHGTKFVAITGGPGGGKSAILEMASHYFCSHVVMLPEAASIVFGGGFPRHFTEAGRRAAQRAIYHVQSELERMVGDEGNAAVALCDRGTIDGLAYWPGNNEEYWTEVKSSLEHELTHYRAVIHLRTPKAVQGYNHQNQLRIESPDEARMIDERIVSIWSAHPRRFLIESHANFLEKAREALTLIRAELPQCCQAHAIS